MKTMRLHCSIGTSKLVKGVEYRVEENTSKYCVGISGNDWVAVSKWRFDSRFSVVTGLGVKVGNYCILNTIDDKLQSGLHAMIGKVKGITTKNSMPYCIVTIGGNDHEVKKSQCLRVAKPEGFNEGGSGIKIVTRYQTKDGSLFETLESANAHQAKLLRTDSLLGAIDMIKTAGCTTEQLQSIQNILGV